MTIRKQSPKTQKSSLTGESKQCQKGQARCKVKEPHRTGHTLETTQGITAGPPERVPAIVRESDKDNLAQSRGSSGFK